MPTRIDIDGLRSRCIAALTVYQSHAVALLEHSKGGQRPPPEELHAEEQALYEYAKARRELLDGLAALYRSGE